MPDVIDIPSDWEEMFTDGSFRYLDDTQPGQVFAATTRGMKACPIAFKSMDTDDPRTSREVEVSMYLSALRSASPYIVRSLEVRQSSMSTFVLLEGVDDVLASITLRPYSPAPGSTYAPASTLLFVVVSLLRGARDLEEAGVVHGGLDDRSIFVESGRPRISALGRSCVERDQVLGCEDLGDSQAFGFDTSAFRHAPEMEDGRPTGPSNHVFMIGLIGAWLSLGELPTMTAVLQYFRPPAVAEAGGEQEIEQEGEGSGRDHVAQEIAKDGLKYLDHSAEGREIVRGIVREHFDITENKAFRSLQDSGIQRLLAGMLARSAEERMTTLEALRYAEHLAEKHQVRIPAEAPDDHGVPDYFWRCWQ